jgi:hypothetical protein
MTWKQLAQMDSLGTSPFQNLCCRELRKFLPDLEFSENGDSEKYFVTNVPMTDITIYVYVDGAALKSSTVNLKLERADSKEPLDLVLRLIKELSNAI